MAVKLRLVLSLYFLLVARFGWVSQIYIVDSTIQKELFTHDLRLFCWVFIYFIFYTEVGLYLDYKQIFNEQ